MFQQTFKNFAINFNNPAATGAFSSGDLITGHIAFELTKEAKINSISMTVTGKALVHWTTGGKKKRTISAKLDFFCLKSAILQQQQNAIGGPSKLPPGTHLFPFSCQLPHGDFPSSFKAPNGVIDYSMTVNIDRPWHMSKNFETKLNFVNHVNVNNPELKAPLSGSNQMTLCCLWCTSPPITMRVRSEKKAFVPGETVKIICAFSNMSSRTATPKVRLQQKLDLYTLNKGSQRNIVKYLVAITGRPVCAETSNANREIALTIPSSAEQTIANCSILVLSYVIEVTLKVPWAHDLTVLIPIIICDTPVEAQGPE